MIARLLRSVKKYPEPIKKNTYFKFATVRFATFIPSLIVIAVQICKLEFHESHFLMIHQCFACKHAIYSPAASRYSSFRLIRSPWLSPYMPTSVSFHMSACLLPNLCLHVYNRLFCCLAVCLLLSPSDLRPVSLHVSFCLLPSPCPYPCLRTYTL